MYFILASIAIGFVSGGLAAPSLPTPVIINDTLGCLLDAANTAFEICYSMRPDHMEVLQEDTKLQQKLNMSPEEYEEGLSDRRQDEYIQILKQVCYAHVMISAFECVIRNEMNNRDPAHASELKHVVGKNWAKLLELED